MGGGGAEKNFSFSFQWDRWSGEWLNVISGAVSFVIRIFLGGVIKSCCWRSLADFGYNWLSGPRGGTVFQ